MYVTRSPSARISVGPNCRNRDDVTYFVEDLNRHSVENEYDVFCFFLSVLLGSENLKESLSFIISFELLTIFFKLCFH